MALHTLQISRIGTSPSNLLLGDLISLQRMVIVWITNTFWWQSLRDNPVCFVDFLLKETQTKVSLCHFPIILIINRAGIWGCRRQWMMWIILTFRWFLWNYFLEELIQLPALSPMTSSDVIMYFINWIELWGFCQTTNRFPREKVERIIV